MLVSTLILLLTFLVSDSDEIEHGQQRKKSKIGLSNGCKGTRSSNGDGPGKGGGSGGTASKRQGGRMKQSDNTKQSDGSSGAGGKRNGTRAVKKSKVYR